MLVANQGGRRRRFSRNTGGGKNNARASVLSSLDATAFIHDNNDLLRYPGRFYGVNERFFIALICS